MSKRRDRTKWIGTAIAPYMQLKSYSDFIHVIELKKSIIHVMETKGLNPTDLARLIDTDKDQSLTISEIVSYFSSKEMQREKNMPRPNKLNALRGPLLQMADKKMDGQISFDEFEEFFS